MDDDNDLTIGKLLKVWDWDGGLGLQLVFYHGASTFTQVPFGQAPFPKPLLPKGNIAKGEHCPRRTLPKMGIVKVDFCRSALIAQVISLPKCPFHVLLLPM